MSYDPADPGPVLDTYDPNWEARFNAVHAKLKAIEDRGWPWRDHALAEQLTQELIDAHEAQYQYLWQFDAAQYGHYRLGAWRDDPAELRVPSPPHTASPAEVRAHYVQLGKARDYRRFVALLPPAIEWGKGVFARTPPAGVSRTVREATIEASRMGLPVRMTLVVERHPGMTHVCAIQGPEDGASVNNDLELVAGWVAEQYLPRRGLLAGLRGSARRLVFHHTYTPTLHGLRRQPVWSHELRRARGGVRIDEFGTREAPPYLRDRSLELGSSVRSDRALA